MPTLSNGKPIPVAPALPVRKREPSPQFPPTGNGLTELHAQIVKHLRKTPGCGSAADEIEKARLYLEGRLLVVQTGLSKTMLQVVVDRAAQEKALSVVEDVSAGQLGLKFLSKSADQQAAATTTVGSFKELQDVAGDLNVVTDTLSREVERIEQALKKLNLGVEAWCEIDRHCEEDGTELIREVGYARWNNKWALSLRTRIVHPVDGIQDDVTAWPFIDAPRHFRIKAAGHIRMLFGQLRNEAAKMIESLSKEVRSLATLAAEIEKESAGGQ